MPLSDNSLSIMKAPSAMMLSLMIASVISPVEAAVSCTSSSPQCCWVRRIWELMGKTTSVSSTSSTACCYYKGSTTQTSGIWGVNCTSTGQVIGLTWSDKYLKNSIPLDIGKLTNLIFLTLAKNGLTGTIPKEIGNLVNLEKLYLYTNQLSGAIPSSIGKLTKLTVLRLNHNQLSGAIPSSIGSLTKLENVELYYNKLTSIPPEIGSCVNLRNFKLDNNQLSSPIPSEIGLLVKLQYLVLHTNPLPGPIPREIGDLTSLTTLHISYTKLSGPIPPEIGNLVNLQYLYLSSNQLSGLIPPEIGNLVNLKNLYLTHNKDLNGTFTPKCTVSLYAVGTSVTVCGCVSATSPPAIFPPPGTPEACLATGPATSLRKRILAFSQVIGSYRFTCNVDSNRNPFQDCLNMMAQICHPDYLGTDSTRINDCKNGVNSMVGQMNSHWQLVRKECGQWSWYGTTGSVTSTNCASATQALQANAFYITNDGSKINVPASLTDSINRGLWSNSALKG